MVRIGLPKKEWEQCPQVVLATTRHERHRLNLAGEEGGEEQAVDDSLFLFCWSIRSKLVSSLVSARAHREQIMSFHSPIVLFVVALLAGCASSPQALKAEPDSHRTFLVDGSYQTVLKRVVDHHQACDTAPFLPIGAVINQVNHYPDLRFASIVRGAEGVGRQIVSVIEIKQERPEVARIDLWAIARPDAFMERYKKVAAGAPGCNL